MLPKVLVLLSSYNGEKYIKQQVESILSQSNVDIQLLIRDDGSNDRTVEIVKEYNDNRISIISANNIGSTASFFQLITMAGEADYYAFSDQDDVWDDDKLSIAVSSLKQYETVPAIYSSNTRLVDQDLQFISNETLNPKTTLGSAIIKNYVTGCTTVFNHALMKYLKKSVNVTVPYHDWWVNLVALSVGGVSVYDVTPHMSYRQHGNNVVGASESIIKKWNQRLNKFFNQPYRRETMAQQLLDIYGNDIDSENRSLLELFVNYKKNKSRMIFNKSIKTNSRADNCAFAVCIITGKI